VLPACLAAVDSMIEKLVPPLSDPYALRSGGRHFIFYIPPKWASLTRLKSISERPVGVPSSEMRNPILGESGICRSDRTI
jgi:hypothetical protein